jgi:tetraacyldisaccharide 4'-kinase
LSSGVAHALRQSLWPLGYLYGAGVWLRDVAYRSGIARSHALPVPVWSVGNLTAGGTGKTPLVLWLAGRLRAAGVRVGVLARGYRRAPGAELNDEGMLLARRLPGLLQVQDPDRLRGGRELVRRGAELVLLDDGFQHRRLRRDLDLVCLDAADPFAGRVLLPAGDLREFRSALRRAQIGVLTRADRLSAEQLAERRARIARVAPDLALHAARHAPAGFVRRPGGALAPDDSVRGRRVLLLAAIARPDAFAATLAGLGAEVVAQVVRRDHHHWSAGELAQVAARAREAGASVVTTEKDDVKLDRWDEPRLVLRIDLEFLGPEPALPALPAR